MWGGMGGRRGGVAMRQSWKIPTNGIQRRPSLSNELSVLAVAFVFYGIG